MAEYRATIGEPGILMRDKYPLDSNRLTPNKYCGQSLSCSDDFSKGDTVGIFISGDDTSHAMAKTLADEALEAGSKVVLYRRSEWYPEYKGRADDSRNTEFAEISKGQSLEQLLNGSFKPCSISQVSNLSTGIILGAYWNRDLFAIKEKSARTLGYISELAGDDGTLCHYLMERDLIENVDECRVADAKNMQILEDRHLNTKNTVKLVGENQSSLSGLKVLFLPEFDLIHDICARWRFEWPANYLGQQGIKYRVRGAMEPVLRRPSLEERKANPALPNLLVRTEAGFETVNGNAQKLILKHLLPDLEWADVVIMGRTNHQYLSDVVSHLKSKGKIIGFDADDLIFGPNGVFKGTLHDGKKCLSDYITDNVKLADFITMSTPQLAIEAASVRGSHDNIYHLPNRVHINELSLKPVKNHNNNGQIRVGWAGGKYHVKKLLELEPTISKLASKYGKKLTFVVKGIHESNMISASEQEDLRNLKQMFEKSGLSYELYPYSDCGNWKKYYDDLQELKLDIAIAPIKNDAEGNGKSELKFLEAAVMGVPLVVPAIGGHKFAVKHDINGMLVNPENPQPGFYDCLDRLIQNPQLRNKIAQNARNDLMNKYDVKQSSEQLYQILLEQVSKKKGFKFAGPIPVEGCMSCLKGKCNRHSKKLVIS